MDTPSPLSGPVFGPQNAASPDAVVLLLHGLGADGNDLIGLAPALAEAAPGAVFISPHAPDPCDMAPPGMNGGKQWFSLQDYTDEACFKGASNAAPVLNTFIDEVLAQHGLDDSRLVLAGFSQGTMMALHVGLRRARPLAGLLGYSGMLTGRSRLPAEITARPPVCLVHGIADAVVPFTALGMAETVLSENGVAVEAFARPGLAHGIDEEGIVLGQNFLRKVL